VVDWARHDFFHLFWVYLYSLVQRFDFVPIFFAPSVAVPTRCLMPGKSPSPGTHTHEAFRKKFDEKRAHEEQLQLALEFMEAGRGGARAVSKLVEGCSRRQIAGALAKATSPAATRPNWQILTPTETEAWLGGSSRAREMTTPPVRRT